MYSSRQHHALRNRPHRGFCLVRDLAPPPWQYGFIHTKDPRRDVQPIAGWQEFHFGEVLHMRVPVGQLEIGDEVRMRVELRMMQHVAVFQDESAKKLAHELVLFSSDGVHQDGEEGGRHRPSAFAIAARAKRSAAVKPFIASTDGAAR